MRYKDDHKATTRGRILREAAREIRAKGPDNFAVAGVMARAGLTHGGFYAHFASKDALVAEVIGTMFEDARGRVSDIDGEGDPRVALRGYVDFYLAREHRDARDRGCPLPALSGDLARSAASARERFGLGIARLTEKLATALARLGEADPGGAASAMLSQLVGAVVLARAVDGAASDAMLDAARNALVTRYRLDDAA